MMFRIILVVCLLAMLPVQGALAATLFFDDFDAGIDPGLYYIEGTPTAAGGIVTLPQNSPPVSNCVQTREAFSYTATDPVTWIGRVRWTSYTPSAGQWFGWTRWGPAWPETYQFGVHWAFGWFNAESNGAEQSTALNQSNSFLDWHVYAVSAKGSELKYYIDGQPVATHTRGSAWPFGDCHAGIYVTEGSDGLQIDWMKVTNEEIIVPEPGSLLVLVSGLGALVGLAARRRA